MECPYRVRDAEALGEQLNPNLVNVDLPSHSKNSNIRPMTYKTTPKYNSKSI